MYFSKMLLILFITHFMSTEGYRCSEDFKLPRYYLIEKCHRSTLGILATANYVSLSSCQKLGLEKKGLALNFSPPEVTDNLSKEVERVHTCEVLKCAESEGGLSLVNDTRFDYYSLYAKPLPNINASCIPGVGMFSLLKKQNFTQALSVCHNKTGFLADILSEQRTDTFAQILSGSNVEAAYVGLRSINGSNYLGLSGNSLECITYRAWEPGHPKRNKQKYGCGAVSRNRAWRTMRCGTRMPAICELYPGGPYKLGSIFEYRNRNDTINITNSIEVPEKVSN